MKFLKFFGYPHYGRYSNVTETREPITGFLDLSYTLHFEEKVLKSTAEHDKPHDDFDADKPEDKFTLVPVTVVYTWENEMIATIRDMTMEQTVDAIEATLAREYEAREPVKPPPVRPRNSPPEDGEEAAPPAPVPGQ